MSENNLEKQFSEEDAQEPKWYVVHTYSGYENKVATDLEKVVENRKLFDLIKEVKVPVEKVVEIKDNKKKEVERKLYPGYVLIKMILTEDAWYVVRNTRGVTGFVGPGSKPVPLTDKEVLELGVENEKKTISTDFNKGDKVKVKSGPLNDYNGEIVSINSETGMATVFIFMFGRKMNVEVEVGNLQKLD